jgi:molybdate transport system substrate-binding protein
MLWKNDNNFICIRPPMHTSVRNSPTLSSDASPIRYEDRSLRLPKKLTYSALNGRSWKYLCAALFATALAGACHAPRRTVLTISVAASLTEAIGEIEAAYKHEHPAVELRNNFGSSGTLAQEIERGAPVDVFLSAAAKPMDELVAKGLIVPGSRQDLLRNTLVLIAPQDSKLENFQGLADGSVRVIALGDPASVPAGQYGQQTLRALHLLDQLGSKLVLAKDVRQVLTYVETGNADAGLVYGTDAQVSGKVRVVATAPDETHDPIVYPVAVINGRNEDEARKFADYLNGSSAKAVFMKRGFTIASP